MQERKGQTNAITTKEEVENILSKQTILELRCDMSLHINDYHM